VSAVLHDGEWKWKAATVRFVANSRKSSIKTDFDLGALVGGEEVL
jgi:hypothetical protein